MAKRLEERHGGAARSAVRDAMADFARARTRLARRLATVELPVRSVDARSGPTLADAIAARLGERGDVLRARLAEVHAPEDAGPAHAARIAAKRLRYLLEPAAPHVEGGVALLEQLERMQDVLGELHDAHVMAVELRAALEDVAAEEARRLGTDVLPRGDGDANGARPEQSIRTLRARRTGLLTLASRLRAEMEGRFAEARARWLEGGADALADEVAMVASRLAARRDENAEIEHKYLLDALPDAARAAPHDEIDQGYLPGALLEERVRRVRSGDVVRCWRTIKFGRGLRRTEVEEEMTLGLFTALWPLTEGRRVRKRRWRMSDGEHEWELDEFLDRELVLAEIELARTDDEVAIPTWLAPHLVREVTGEDAYVNVNLAS
jgi:CYTH domain-containing protein